MSKTEYSTALLRERIRGLGIQQNELASRLGLSEWAMGQKLLGRYEFKASEIDALIKILSIEDRDIRTFFFTQKFGISQNREEAR